MIEPEPRIVSDPQLQNDLMLQSHALVVAVANREDDDLVLSLFNELYGMATGVDDKPGAFALGFVLNSLRLALDSAEGLNAGFRETFLRTVGAQLVIEPP